MAAVMPGKCAAPPAPAMITSIPFEAAFSHIHKAVSVFYVLKFFDSCGIFNFLRVDDVFIITGQSDLDPIIIPIRLLDFHKQIVQYKNVHNSLYFLLVKHLDVLYNLQNEAYYDCNYRWSRFIGSNLLKSLNEKRLIIS